MGFVIGSSLPVFAITMSYVGKAFHKQGHKGIKHYEAVPFVVPAVLGTANALNLTGQPAQATPAQRRKRTALFGDAAGLTLSVIGHEGFDLPTRIFGMSESDAKRVHVIAPLIYAAIFGIVANFVNERLR